jgi:hypothetical protein
MPNRKKQIYRFLNNVQFTAAYVQGVKNYITNNVMPLGMNARQQATFRERFDQDWAVVQDELVFTPLHLIAVPEELAQEVLTVLYDDPIHSLGKGINSFYDTVRSLFVGITRSVTEEFLKRQEVYQLSFQQPKKSRKPVYAQFCNEKWGCDLLDMNAYVGHNANQRYILTVIDYFSRRAFAKGINNKEPNTVQNALQNICHNIGVHPQLLICDNGNEFQLDAWCQQHNTKLVRTESHSPTQNALVENFNGQLRRLMRSNFIRTNTLNWRNHLDTLIETYNNTKHSVTKFKPIDVYTNDRQRVQIENVGPNVMMLNNNQKKSEILKATNAKATLMTAQLQREHLNVGDHVRVSTSALHSEIRRRNKVGDSKLVPVKFSANIFTVGKVVKSRKHAAVAIDRYELRHQNGDWVVKEGFIQDHPNAPRKRFNIYDLQRVPEDTIVTRTKQNETHLNRIPYDPHFDLVN